VGFDTLVQDRGRALHAESQLDRRTHAVRPAEGDRVVGAKQPEELHDWGAGIGRYRKQEIVMGGTAKNIDPSGTIPLPSDGSNITFSNYVDLIDKLSATPDIYSCFASQYMDYAIDLPTLEIMKGIKKVFDPNGILNPGKMFV